MLSRPRIWNHCGQFGSGEAILFEPMLITGNAVDTKTRSGPEAGRAHSAFSTDDGRAKIAGLDPHGRENGRPGSVSGRCRQVGYCRRGKDHSPRETVGMADAARAGSAASPDETSRQPDCATVSRSRDCHRPAHGAISESTEKSGREQHDDRLSQGPENGYEDRRFYLGPTDMIGCVEKTCW